MHFFFHLLQPICSDYQTIETKKLHNIFFSENLVEKYGSWEKQNLDETKKLANSFPNSGGRAIIMGDLNAGPFTPIQGDEGYHMGKFLFRFENSYAHLSFVVWNIEIFNTHTHTHMITHDT